MRPSMPVLAGGVQHDWKQQPCIAQLENPDCGIWTFCGRVAESGSIEAAAGDPRFWRAA